MLRATWVCAPAASAAACPGSRRRTARSGFSLPATRRPPTSAKPSELRSGARTWKPRRRDSHRTSRCSSAAQISTGRLVSLAYKRVHERGLAREGVGVPSCWSVSSRPYQPAIAADDERRRGRDGRAEPSRPRGRRAADPAGGRNEPRRRRFVEPRVEQHRAMRRSACAIRPRERRAPGSRAIASSTAGVRDGRELAVDVRVDVGVGDGKRDSSARCAPLHDLERRAVPAPSANAARSFSRARDNRDITVPTGIPSTAAISSYRNSSTTASSSTSRCSTATFPRAA